MNLYTTTKLLLWTKLYEKKINFSLKSVIITTAIISLPYKETNETVSFTLFSQKRS